MFASVSALALTPTPRRSVSSTSVSVSPSTPSAVTSVDVVDTDAAAVGGDVADEDDEEG
jgi:hypothetical protein